MVNEAAQRPFGIGDLLCISFASLTEPIPRRKETRVDPFTLSQEFLSTRNGGQSLGEEILRRAGNVVKSGPFLRGSARLRLDELFLETSPQSPSR